MLSDLSLQQIVQLSQVWETIAVYYLYLLTYYSFYSLVGGGGGAPLKDVTGGTVTNLRSVIRG